MRKNHFLLCLFLLLTCTLTLQAQHASDEELKQANNPMAHVTAVNVHNYYTSKLVDGGDLVSNTAWLRIAQPMGKFLFRASLPFSTMPSRTSSDAHSVTGLGDMSLFAIMKLSKLSSANQFGIGPMVVAPTSTEADNLGSGKWQLGAAAMVFLAKNPLFQNGALLTWQASVAGQDDRPDVSLMTFQPFMMWQVGGGTYLRSSATWNFDLEGGFYNVPIGMGIGKAVKVEKTLFNIFVEPQYSVLHYGTWQPQFQVFVGFNIQFQ